MMLAWFPITSSWNTACYIRGLIHGIGRGVPNVNSAIHLFIIWFTDILANLDIQTELQDCLYENGFKDK